MRNTRSVDVQRPFLQGPRLWIMLGAGAGRVSFQPPTRAVLCIYALALESDARYFPATESV